MRVKIANNRICIEGHGVALLRLKADIIKELTEANISHESSSGFSVPLDCATLVIEHLQKSGHFQSENLDEIFKERLHKEKAHLNGKLAAETALSDDNYEATDTYWGSLLKPYQAKAVKALLTNGLLGACLFDEQGAGKTITAISLLDQMFAQGSVDLAIILSPKSMLHEWPKEIDRFLPKKYSVTTVEGSFQERHKLLNSASQIYCLNFESVQSHLATIKGTLRGKHTILVVDESFYVKNHRAIRSVAIREIRRYCKFGLVLCGTPAPNSPLDIISQFDIADDGYTFAGFSVPQHDEKIKEAITNRIESRGVLIRRLKSEVLPELPPKLFTIHKVKLGRKQRELYENVRRSLVLELKQMDNRSFKRILSSYFQKRAALLQICLRPTLIDPLFTDEPAKYLALDSLIHKIVEKNNEKVVIWSFYTESINDICTRYEHLGIVRIDGGVSTSVRKSAVKEFQSNPNIKIFVGNPAAAGAGITLHAAAHSIYLSYSNQAAHFLQSIDRIHRIGQNADKVEVTLLVAEGTIEESEVARLGHKVTNQHELLNDKVNFPSSLDEAISELENV
jgi:SNF2 family DNA or RNA helicase